MQTILTFLATHHLKFVFGILVFFGLIEAIFGYLANSKRSKNDILVELINTIVLIGITKPILVWLTYKLMQVCFPQQEGIFAKISFVLGLLLFVLVDDFLQYWYHRAAHEYKWLWKLHRPHHTATEMGLLVSYRQVIYYYFLMPNIWWFGIFSYFFGGIPVAIGIILKQLIVISSHSLAKWDSPFYENKPLLPIIKVLERVFITPAFHHSHHAVSQIDGIGNPNGNYGNMLSIWDQLFGTAKFTHEFPAEYGIPEKVNDSWQTECFYPIFTSEDEKSEFSKAYIFEKTTQNEPAILTLKEGNYLYCQCGFSKNQPFCDGSHHGTKHKPLTFTINKERECKLCQCKLTKKGPYCDNSHLEQKNR